MKKWIHFPRVEGTVSRQAHADLPAGTYEREIGRDGFFGPATHMYHAHPPTSWSSFEGSQRPRAFDATRLSATSTCPWRAVPLLANAHLQIRWWVCDAPMDHLVRNADGDELLFVHEGTGSFYTDYGHLVLAEGDYVCLPRGTLWRVAPEASMKLLLIESTQAAYRLPDRGSLGEHAVFDPALLDTPRLDARFKAQQDERPWKILVKARDALSTITYPYNPLDAVGWKGTLAPVRINWRNIRPVMSARYHLPPSAHTTFVSDRFVVCTFCPRPLETDPKALKVPFYHSNDDYDEVLFYHRGQFFSRDNIHPGMLTYHPFGFTHGPHPKALESSVRAPKTATDEVAVMVDARDSLKVTDEAQGVEWREYVDSWRTT